VNHRAQEAFYALDVTLNLIPIAKLIPERTTFIGAELRMGINGHVISCTSF